MKPRQLRGLDATWWRTVGWFSKFRPKTKRYIEEALQVQDHAQLLEKETDSFIRSSCSEIRERYRTGKEFPEDRLHGASLWAESVRRTMHLTPHLEQIAGGLAMIDGTIIEMATGEGKTITATLPAMFAGWKGDGCHVVTVNDYLSSRDAKWMGTIYAMCGVTVGSVVHETTPDERKISYAKDVTYASSKELAADFLRDCLVVRSTPGLVPTLIDSIIGGDGHFDRVLQRGLSHVIVDEADSVLIDEAVTPLIISSQGGHVEAALYQQAAELARSFCISDDFTIDERYREINMTEAGVEKLDQLCDSLEGVWRGRRRREELITQAITAREMYEEGTNYVVDDEKVVIVDEFTGRLMPDRSWRDGLHQAVEAKEGLEIQSSKDTIARVSFQRFFRSYDHLCGMTGTAQESIDEFWNVYETAVVVIPSHRPCIREQLPDLCFETKEEKLKAVLGEVVDVADSGRPVLVGVRSVEESVQLSNALQTIGRPHELLNATRHDEEARIIQGAGAASHITIATNMAGRGTDITLADGVATNGGMHVIITEKHEAARIDRQFYGRAGRQGDAGSARAFVCREDEVLCRFGSPDGTLDRLTNAMAKAQSKASGIALRRRVGVLKSDTWLDEALGFAGLGR